MAKKKLTFVLMDPPYEQARTVTAMRILDVASRRGHDLGVFCYEGAVALAFAKQAAHGNAVHGRDVAEEDHPLPKDWIAGLIDTAGKAGGAVEWINCGLCVDERGVNEVAAGIKRGSPVDLWKMAEASDNTLVIGTK